ncbi:thiamine phosphate synthase superfamily [Phlyctochytrium arcticum]|nr:thiamine phosphate synthase superfamily [Phlyctochytrium arcticum]
MNFRDCGLPKVLPDTSRLTNFLTKLESMVADPAGAAKQWPPIYVISDDPSKSLATGSLEGASLDRFVDQLAVVLQASRKAAVDNGTSVPYVQIRIKAADFALDEPFLHELCGKLVHHPLLAGQGVPWTKQLLLNTSSHEALLQSVSHCEKFSLGGVHLAGNLLHLPAIGVDLEAYGADLIVAASSHDAQDLVTAQKLGLSFAVLSPVLPSISCPSDAYLGWETFASLCQTTNGALPIYALGGLRYADLPAALASGAVGVAAIKSFWHDLEYS